jgi:two-component system, chemotaxis family, protein-glutamate methylesterase/glutaminase
MVASKSWNNRVFGVGASAGGIETMRELLRLLPQDFPAPTLLVIHTAMDSPGLLARVLQRQSGVLVVNANNGEKIQGSHIYVAPPNFHLLVEGNACG